MKMPLLKIEGFTPWKQYKKIEEEDEEFRREKSGTKNELAELLDSMQVRITYLTHVYTKEEIEEGMRTHFDKIESRKNKLIGYIDIKLHD